MAQVLKVSGAVLGVIALGIAVAATAYFFWIYEDEETTNLDVSGVTVTGVLISNEIDSNGLPVNPRLSLPAGIRAVRATVRLEGTAVGMTVKGTWFQLGTSRSGAEGAEVSSSEVLLTTAEVSADGSAALSFSLGTNGPALPTDAWLLRVYVDGRLVKTSGFVIGGAVVIPVAPPATTSPVPGAPRVP